MYYYLYDTFLSDNKYQKTLHRIENRLVDLGIDGKIGRLSMMMNVEKLLNEEIKKGAKTIVAVGNNNTIDKIINIAAAEKITVGVIPVGENNEIAEILGIPPMDLACDILSRRRVKKIDLLKINRRYYILNLKMDADKNIEIVCEDKYKVKLTAKKGEIYIYNLVNKEYIKNNFKFKKSIENFFSPQDKMFDIVINPTDTSLANNLLKIFRRKQAGGATLIPGKKIKISAKKIVSAVCDNNNVVKTPLDIKIVPQVLKIIVGKNRKF
ncbi:MAG: diacylglycerol kinase family protein [Patescibacteria group bacterium]|nr:diacylglycerol kinase family protein [Patescibacteria group bacterium]